MAVFHCTAATRTTSSLIDLRIGCPKVGETLDYLLGREGK